MEFLFLGEELEFELSDKIYRNFGSDLGFEVGISEVSGSCVPVVVGCGLVASGNVVDSGVVGFRNGLSTCEETDSLGSSVELSLGTDS